MSASGQPGRSSRAPVWLLDLDNTLHDAGAHVFPRINQAMTDYVARRLGVDHDEAGRLRTHYWQRYGATLLGLVRHHGVDAHEFLRETHPFPDLHRLVRRDLALRDALRRLPGRRIVLTNAPREYARAVLRHLGVAPYVESLIAIEDMRFGGQLRPKPSRPMLARIVAGLRVAPRRCILVEDSPDNLASARACGLRTVLVTGLSHRARGYHGTPRAGRGRRIDVQVQSARSLPRIVSKMK